MNLELESKGIPGFFCRHCRHAQPVRADMCTDDGGHVNDKDITRDKFTMFGHQRVEEISLEVDNMSADDLLAELLG